MAAYVAEELDVKVTLTESPAATVLAPLEVALPGVELRAKADRLVTDVEFILTLAVIVPATV